MSRRHQASRTPAALRAEPLDRNRNVAHRRVDSRVAVAADQGARLSRELHVVPELDCAAVAAVSQEESVDVVGDLVTRVGSLLPGARPDSDTALRAEHGIEGLR